MPTLNPSETFPIVRVLADHTDAGTNYVQAVIRNAVTDAVLDTVNLTDKGNRRFTKLWKVPYDNINNQGRFIVITTTVYTDSGYTTKNTNYGEDGVTYLIQQRFDLRYLPAGGGMDYNEHRKGVAEELAKLKFPEYPKYEPTPPLDTAPLIDELDRRMQMHIQNAVGGIPTPEAPEKVDLRSIEAAIANVAALIHNLPRFEKTDQSGIINALHELHGTIEQAKADTIKAMDDCTATIEEQVKPIIEQTAHENVIQGIKNGSINLSLNKSPEEKQKDNMLKRLAAKYKR